MSFNRREILQGLAAVGVITGAHAKRAFAADTRKAHTIGFEPRAIVIDGAPRFLICGSIDYFRCPSAHWPDILLRAKRNGLNCVMTYVAWNWHERQEGTFDFDGDADLGRFLDLCAELGLLAFPRPGPFICDDWEAGGHPAWLYAKPGLELRIQNAVLLTYVRRWFQRLVPILASRQVTRGGPVVLVQQENEYYDEGRAGAQEYQRNLIALMREFGIDVPITDCNGDSPNIRVAESFMTQNGGGAKAIAKARRAHPHAPAISTELYTGWGTCWDWPVSSYPTPRAMQQQVFDTLAAGGMYSYFMTYGGTNFGFMASTSWKSDQAFVTTRYYPRSPILEGGAFSDLYFPAKAVNQLGLTYEADLASAEDAPTPFEVAGPVRANAVKTPRGILVFIQPKHPVSGEMIYHTDGQGALTQLAEDFPYSELASQPGAIRTSGFTVELANRSEIPSLLPWNFRIDSSLTLDHTTATLMGILGTLDARVLVFCGDAGRRSLVSINSVAVEFVFSATEPVIVRRGSLTIIGVCGLLADRTWMVDGRAVIGPAYVGAAKSGLHECYIDGETEAIVSIGLDGGIKRRPVKPAAIPTLKVPLTAFVGQSFDETRMTFEGWRELGDPRPVEDLGAYYGYTWYRARYRSDGDRTAALMCSAASDRISVFLNGKRSGLWGAGRGATRDPLPINLVRGVNEFVFMADNMGRLSEGARVEHKGIYGPVYVDAAVISVEPSAIRVAPNNPPTRSWTFQTFEQFLSTPAQFYQTSYTLQVSRGDGLILSLRSFSQYAWILINGKVVAEHSGDTSVANGVDFNNFTLDQYVTGEPLTVDIVLHGDRPRDIASQVVFIRYDKNSALNSWAFRPWSAPTAAGRPTQGEPIYWTTRFALPASPGPWILVTEGLSKGQAYINGHALGRYWEVGPQHSLYVPTSWLESDNRLSLFDEEGSNPDQVYLMRDARVPTEVVLA